MKVRILLAMATVLIAGPGVLFASTISINISFRNAVIVIKAGTAFGNQTVNYFNNKTKDSGSGETDFYGDANVDAAVGKNDTFNISVGTEQWSDLSVGNNPGIISDGEKKKAGAIKSLIPNFDGSYNSYLMGPTGFFDDTFSLVNTGPNGYLFDSLQLYTGLDLNFFTAPGFNSAAAIASGSLFRDVTAELGQIEILPGETLPFSVGDVPVNTYELLIATVQEELPGGQLGPQQNLAIGGAVPEPPMLPLLVLAMCGYIGWCQSRARAH